jgi:UDP-N-acetyl-2-amino-2-deoxyglucuronate dehydrogenase
MSFAILGVAGYVAPRHLEAIRAAGHRVVAAMDPHDSVGVLDRYFPNARYFRDLAGFERHLDALARRGERDRVDFVSICSPNDLHESHVRVALSRGAHAICEKPVAIEPTSLDRLADLEREAGRRVYTVLQLRHHSTLVELRRRIQGTAAGRHRHQVVMTYVTPRGRWYHASWKGDESRSGGLGTNIGIHLFDLLLWLFGPKRRVTLHARSRTRMAGSLELERADVCWLLSIDARDLPPSHRAASHRTGPPRPFRSLRIDGEAIPFEAPPELHTDVYRAILDGNGLGLEAARPAVELVHTLRHAPLSPDRGSRRSHEVAATAAHSEGANELLPA